ncbi:MAG TPA: hypothetical protein DG048_10330 [Pseudoalteromonas sp.]|jgi:hypothetical protein|nr:hypothetical protein [Pseudoalteromonas sp.]|tara:strand:+ start:76447 stop:78072 length:1626 start_codon:yes stop_codon:yes gene_type:complete
MQLSINAQKTIQNFSSVMTDSSKVISELIQNSRRAGATRIDINFDMDSNTLQIQDNGTGVSKFENLITLSDSGWSDAARSIENPFGMGFFSTLFAAKQVVIESSGKSLIIDTATALNFEDIGQPTDSASCPNEGTRITLIDFNKDGSDYSIQDKVSDLALFSSVDIYFNGELQENKLALHLLEKEYETIETPYGTLVCKHKFSNKIAIVCQELRVGKHKSFSNYLFLNNSVQLRMPDRDAIINAEMFEKEVDKWLDAYWANKLEELRNDLQDDIAFVEKHFRAIIRYSKTLLNDIDYLPSVAFSSTPVLSCRDMISDSPYEVLKREEVADKIIYSDYDMWNKGILAHHFFHFSNALMLNTQLDPNHWIYESIILDDECNNDDFEVSTESGNLLDYSLQYSEFGVALVYDSDITIKHIPSGKVVNIDNSNSFALWDHCLESDISIRCGEDELTPTLVIGKTAHVESELLLQLSRYQSEFDEDLDAELHTDTRALSQQVNAFIKDDPLQVLSDMIGQLPPVLQTKLAGQTLTAKIENGKLSFA